MTDNEKAAIAGVRWIPGQKCEASHVQCRDDYQWCYATELAQCLPNGHTILSPDMDDPRNFMQALQRLASKYGYIGFSLDAKGNCHLWGTGFDVRESTKVAALAALYDPEHSE